MAIAVSSPRSTCQARVAPGNLFRRLSAQAMGMKAAALCHRSHWVPKSSRSSCSNCRRSFRLWASKHHCRLCGEIVCGACSTKRIRFQRKSVRTCDDCVDTSVHNSSERNGSHSTSRCQRSNTSPAALGAYDVDEQCRSLELKPRPTGRRGLRRHHSSFAASFTPCLGPRRRTTTAPSSRSSTRVDTSSSSSSSSSFSTEKLAVGNYRLTFSRQTQLLSFVFAALVVLLGCALERMTHLWMYSPSQVLKGYDTMDDVIARSIWS